MKSSSKKPDLAGTSERQDLRIFGNIYGTSQHPYVKHFRKCFTLSVGLFKDRQGPSILIVPDVAVAAYSSGLFLGTPAPLNAHAKNLNKLTIESVSVFSHRTLIQLFECAAQLSALLINVNAYLQLVVEVGKRAAGAVIQFKKKTHEIRRTHSTASLTPSTSADQIRTWKNLERTINICRRCYLNRTGFPRSGSTLLEAQFSCS